MKVRRFMLVLVLSILGGVVRVGVANAIPERPERRFAQWSGANWGMMITVPRIARYGDEIQAHGTVVGGPAADPWWSCSQYSAWTANGTSGINVAVPGSWEMPSSVIDYFGNRVSIMERDAGDPPPYGWEGRISDTCYCVVTDFGAQGGLRVPRISAEVLPPDGPVQPARGPRQVRQGHQRQRLDHDHGAVLGAGGGGLDGLGDGLDLRAR